MKMQKTLIGLCAAVLVQAMTMTPGHAEAVIEKPVVADTPAKFAEIVEQLHEQMGSGGRYEFIKPVQKADAEADMGSMSAMLQKAGSVSAMDEKERIRLFNTQEHLNGILTQSDRNRLVCKHRAPSGTMLPVTTCMTVAEIENQNRDSKNFLHDVQMKQAVPITNISGSH